MITATAPYSVEQAQNARTPIYQVRIFFPPPTPPTAYWNLNEASGSRADSIGSNTLTDNNTVTSAAGIVSTAAQFTAANTEYLNSADNLVLSTGDIDFAVSGWVYLDTKTADMTWIAKEATSTGEYLCRYAVGVDRFTFNVYNSSNGNIGSATANSFGSAPTGQWLFIYAYHDAANNEVGISVNNGPIDTAATSGVPSNTTALFYIGQSGFGGSPSELWNGRIDEVGFWKRRLSPAEVTALYNGGAGHSLTEFLNSTESDDFCTARPVTGDQIGTEILQVIELNQHTEVERCRFPLSTFTFELQDVDDVVTDLAASGLEGRRCEFWIGFYDIWSPVQRFGGIITESSHEGATYRIMARSPMVVAQDKQIFNAAQTQLTAAASSVDTTISVVDTSAFDLPGAADPWGDTSIYINIDNEVLFFAASTPTTFTSGSRVGTFRFIAPPELPGSEAASHIIKSAVRELVLLGALTATNSDSGTNNLHPIDLLTVLFTDSNTKFALNTSVVEINTTELAAVRTALGSQLKFRFVQDAPLNAKKFLEEELYRCLAGYPTEDEQGRVSMKLYQDAAAATIVDTVIDADIVAFPRWVRNAENRINTILLRYDYNPITREFMSAFEYKDTSLIAEHGRELPLSIDSRGIRGSVTGGPLSLTWFSATAAFLVSMAQRHIARFGNRAPLLAVRTLFTKQLLEVGDDVSCSFSYVPNLDTAEKSISNKPFEIVGMRHDFVNGVIDMELLGYPDA